MRKTLFLIALGALVGVPSLALASSPSKPVWVTNCVRSEYKPKTILLACGDGSNGLVKLKWADWSRSKASGSGIDAFDTCTPSCVAGKIKKKAVTVTLSKPIHCAHRRHEVFDRALLSFHGESGPNSQQTFVLGCPTR